MKKQFLLCVSGAALLVLTAFVALPAARDLWGRYKEKRAATRAVHFLEASDVPNADICARQAIALNASNLPACRVMATLAERAGMPQLLDWRCRIAAIAPTVDNRLQLTAAALKIQPPPCPLADSTLRGLASEATNLIQFHVLSAELALKQNRPAAARAWFLSATYLDPTNLFHAINAAALGLASTNAAIASGSRADLQTVADNPGAGAAPTAVALRWLTTDAISHHDLRVALTNSTRLVALSSATLEDHLQNLSILRETADPHFETSLALLQRAVATNSANIKTLTGWMLANSLVSRARPWLFQLPPDIRSQLPVRLALSDCYVAAKDWPSLTAYLESSQWAEAEFMRLALLSQAALEQKQSLRAKANWRLALYAAGDRPGALASLADFAARWNRKTDRVEIFWTITEKFPNENWAWAELDRLLSAAGDTRALQKLYASRLSTGAKDSVARNNFAALSMLLGIQLPKAYATARELFGEHPDDPFIVSTYAYSLYLQNHTKEGLAAMERIKAESLARHPLVLYHALLLASEHHYERVASCLAAIDASRLLPEEKVILERLKAETRANGFGG